MKLDYWHHNIVDTDSFDVSVWHVSEMNPVTSKQHTANVNKIYCIALHELDNMIGSIMDVYLANTEECNVLALEVLRANYRDT